MYNSLILDLSTSTVRSKGQALRRQRLPLSEETRKAERQTTRRNRRDFLKRQTRVPTAMWVFHQLINSSGIECHYSTPSRSTPLNSLNCVPLSQSSNGETDSAGISQGFRGQEMALPDNPLFTVFAAEIPKNYRALAQAKSHLHRWLQGKENKIPERLRNTLNGSLLSDTTVNADCLTGNKSKEASVFVEQDEFANDLEARTNEMQGAEALFDLWMKWPMDNWEQERIIPYVEQDNHLAFLSMSGPNLHSELGNDPSNMERQITQVGSREDTQFYPNFEDPGFGSFLSQSEATYRFPESNVRSQIETTGQGPNL